MMLPADLAILHDPEFKKYAELYAKDEKAFFADFSAAFAKVRRIWLLRIFVIREDMLF